MASAVVLFPAVSVGAVGVPVKVGEAKFAFKSSLALNLLIACNILSVAATVPAPLTNPVNNLPVTVEAEMAVALCVPVTSPESEPEKLVAVPLVISEVKATVPVASGSVIVLFVVVTVTGA